jgi:hypothetical protein
MKVIYFVIREPRHPKDGESKALAQFDDGVEARKRVEEETARDGNKGYQIYLHAVSESQNQRSKSSRFLLF